MGMSTQVIGIKTPTKKWDELKRVYDSCTAAGISLPKEVIQYFGDDDPNEHEEGLEVDLTEMVCCSEYETTDESGYEVLLDQLPEGITKIRFTNSW